MFWSSSQNSKRTTPQTKMLHPWSYNGRYTKHNHLRLVGAVGSCCCHRTEQGPGKVCYRAANAAALSGGPAQWPFRARATSWPCQLASSLMGCCKLRGREAEVTFSHLFSGSLSDNGFGSTCVCAGRCGNVLDILHSFLIIQAGTMHAISSQHPQSKLGSGSRHMD